MYTLIAVFVHFNHFVDLKINFHTNPYKKWLPVGCCDSGLPVIAHEQKRDPSLNSLLIKTTSASSSQDTL